MEYKDFDQQWQQLSGDMQSERCPMTDAELDREVRRVLWSDTPQVASSERKVVGGKWKAWVAAAACVAAVVVPLAIRGGVERDGIRTVNVDGEQIVFACNSGCSPDGTIETFKTYLQ